MKSRRTRQGGQALIMISLSLFAMCGLLGLAVDLGWSFYVKKSAQAAADSAALAAVAAGQRRNPGTPPFTCGTTSGKSLFCTTGPVTCSSIGPSSGSNLYNACQYAAQNGFTDGGNVKVTVDADVKANRLPPTVAGVDAFYWVTVRVNQQIPQLFSAILGNSTGLVSSRATAALTNVVFNSSLDLLNRQNDPNPDNGTGVDLNMQGSQSKGAGGTIQAPGGMFLASNIAGTAVQGGQSAVNNTPFSYFRGGGTCIAGGNGNGACNWSAPWTNGKSDGPMFWDPTRGLAQPPLDTSGSPNVYAVTDPKSGGQFGPSSIFDANTGKPITISGDGSAQNPYTLPAGQYYAASSCTTLPCPASGQALLFSGGVNYRFGNGSASSFGQYIFYGGLSTMGGNTGINFSPGRYVLAGIDPNQNKTNAEFYVDNGTAIKDVGQTSSPGELFIYTDLNYTWGGGYKLSDMLPQAIQNYGVQNFRYGETGFKAGNSDKSSFSLQGLNTSASNLPPELKEYAPYLLWQDRGNTHVAYDAKGNIVTSGLGCVTETGQFSGSMDDPCTNGKVSSSSTTPRMNLQATPTNNMTGAVYQPRGAWLALQGGGNVNGALQIVTGSLNIQGSPTVILTGLAAPIEIMTTALIE